MKLTQIYQNEYARLEADPEKLFIQLTWLQHTSGESLRQVMEISLQHARAQGFRLWLTDMRKLNYTTVADQLWTVKEFIPALDLRQHHRSACVVNQQNIDMIPDTLIQKAVQQHTHSTLAGSIELAVFLDFEMAKAWLFL